MPEITELMKRPSKNDCIVKRRAIEMFMPKVKSYLGSDWSESEQPHIEEQLMKVMSANRDGYEMARDLENNYGWAEDRALMDLMDEGESFLSDSHKEILYQWIKCYGIAPERKVGDTVSTNHWHRKGQVGIITKIDEDKATYYVRFPDQPSTSAQILSYEEVIDAPEVVSADVA